MKTWCPLWSDITTSSIWGEPNHVRILWITMLALKDRDGFVSAAVPGLARAANLSMDEVQEGLKVLESPDPYSRSTEYEGRRIQRVEGGWTVLNHFKHRDKIKDEYRRDYQRRKQAEYRAKKKLKNSPQFSERLNEHQEKQ